MRVRNFWVRADIDGRATPFEGGPSSKDGGFDLSIKMRSEDSLPVEALSIIGRVSDHGTTLTIKVFDNEGHKVFEKETYRVEDK